MKATQGAIDNTAISAYQDYCDGYGMPGATGKGYVSVLKVTTEAVLANAPASSQEYDFLLSGIVAYDRAEAADAYIGQINMGTASSFCGLAGQVWGYDIAIADDIYHNILPPMFTINQYEGTPLPVYDGTPLLEAGISLFGRRDIRAFRPAPGAYVVCANKSVTALRPLDGPLNPAQGDAYGVWAYIAISITKDRAASADLFIEDAGLWTENTNLIEFSEFLNAHRDQVMWSIVKCGEDQGVVYDRTYISYAYRIMEPGQVGTALTCAPYVTLAQRAVPPEGFASLNYMTLSKWKIQTGVPADIHKGAYSPGNNFLGAHNPNIDPKYRTRGLGYRRRHG